MANLHSDDWNERYEEIEHAYRQNQWATVMETGTPLLKDLLMGEGEPEALALRYRLQLLIAHTLLHGYGDRDAAEDLYEVVRRSEAEPALRQIAEDGLDQCHQPLPSTVGLKEEEEELDATEPDRPTHFLPESEQLEGAEDRGPTKATDPLSQLPRMPQPTRHPKANQEPVERPKTAEKAAILGMAADPFRSSESPPPEQRAEEATPVMPWAHPTPFSTDTSATQPVAPVWVAPDLGATELVVADGVDGPELMDVHQADPPLEEDNLEIQPEPLGPHPVSGEAADVPLDGDLKRGLLLVVVG